MKKNNYKRIIGMVLSVILAASLSCPPVFAQMNSKEARLAKEESLKDYLVDDTSEHSEGDVDLSRLPDIGELNIERLADEDSTNNLSDENFPELTTEVDPKNEILQKGGRNNTKEQLEVDTSQLNEQKEQSKLRSLTIPKAASNSDPNSAIYLPSEYFGAVLSDVADANDHWYYFESSSNKKLSIVFSQQDSGDYDIALYKLNGSTLELVDASANQGTFEKITYIADSGVYFLRVNPYEAAPEPYEFTFIVNPISNYDSYEPNDSPDTAAPFTNSMNVSANIDNSYDEDYYKLSIITSRSVNITLSNAPSGSHYAVFLYNGNFESLGSFLVDGSASRTTTLASGDYYIIVASYTGSFTSDHYKLTVYEKVPGTVLASGHRVYLDGDKLFINGVEAQINGVYMSYDYPSYRVEESIHNEGDLQFAGSPCAYRHTYFTDGIEYRTSTVVPLIITKGYYHCFNGRFGYWSHYFDTESDNPLSQQTTKVNNILILVDLDTGKVVDNNCSMHYTRPDIYAGISWIEPVPY